MKVFLSSVLFLSLLQSAYALPTGKWIADFSGVVGTVEFEEKAFALVVTEGEQSVGFSGPLVSATEPEGGRPGRAIIGPIEGSRSPYEVVWYYNPDESRARFYFADQGFPSVAEAEATQAQFELEEADPFMTVEFFEKVSALPAMPELSREQFISLLTDALASKQKSSHKDTDLQMDDLVIARGYDPLKSHESFDNAMKTFGEDAEVKRLLSELSQ